MQPQETADGWTVRVDLTCYIFGEEMKIYLVDGAVEFEESFPIKAFKLKIKALKFKKECELEKKLNPEKESADRYSISEIDYEI